MTSAEIDGLLSVDRNVLIDQWKKVMGPAPPNRLSRPMMAKILAAQLQWQASGLSRAAMVRTTLFWCCRMNKVRCAIYTRKSTQEGLDQAFNSLDAQRGACEAYIKSQKHEGWKPLPDQYNDGGASGGNLERPSLKRRLEDIDAGRIDMIVVYKIDRLTRSLTDFSKLIERLEKAGTSFVSVTQQFNTSTSMGRLTLNVLLSFAQFEREVTAERIRDKIAASKKRGMWMGRLVPLGFDKAETGLIINQAEAKTAQALFEAYLRLGCVRKVKNFADAHELKTKRRVYESGRESGGIGFSRGRLYHLLSNPIYIGKIRHRDDLYEGLHESLIDLQLWDDVQQKLASNRVARTSRKNIPNRSPLAGKLFDQDGFALTPNHANKNGRRYRYYISKNRGGGKRVGGCRAFRNQRRSAGSFALEWNTP